MVGRIKLTFISILLIAGCRINNDPSPSIIQARFVQEEYTVDKPICITATVFSSKPTSVEYAWFVNGHQVLNAASKHLPPHYYSKHDTIECVLYAISNTGSETPGDTIGPLIVRNSHPKVSWADFTPKKNIHKGTDISIVYGVDDADDDNIILSYNWYLDNELVSSDSLLSGKLLEGGKLLSAEILPFDGEDYGEPYPLPRKINIQNIPPKILGASNPTMVDSIVTCKVEFIDLDGDEVSLHMKQGPRGMTIDDLGNITWKYPGISRDTIYTIVIQATDASGASSLGRFKIRLSLL
jgi:hypothetical protein